MTDRSSVGVGRPLSVTGDHCSATSPTEIRWLCQSENSRERRMCAFRMFSRYIASARQRRDVADRKGTSAASTA